MESRKNLRQVEYTFRWYENTGSKSRTEKGFFHCWGTSIIETNEGNSQYSVGLVELESGNIIEVIPTDIKFIS